MTREEPGHLANPRQFVSDQIDNWDPPVSGPAHGVGGVLPTPGTPWTDRIIVRTLSLALSSETAATLVLVTQADAVASSIEPGSPFTFGPSGAAHLSGLPLADCGEIDHDPVVEDQLLHALSDDARSLRSPTVPTAVRKILELCSLLHDPIGFVHLSIRPGADVESASRRIGTALEGEAGVLVFGVSDLTRYGTRYGFVPAGVGDGAESWFLDNDAVVLEWIRALDSERLLTDAASQHSITDPLPVAMAMRVAMRREGWEGVLVEYAASHREQGEPLFRESTGHAGFLF